MEVNNKKFKTEEDILEMFGIKKSTILEWYRKGLKRFKINRKNYIFEDEFESFLRGLSE